jgi:GNAT superfamily N-acetyltransferase
VKIFAPNGNVVADCERILRTLPAWFGNESALVEYARATITYPTYLAGDEDGTKAFLSIRQHFRESWEIHCIAVDASFRNGGIGRALLNHAEGWLRQNGAKLLQVKTLAESHSSLEYGETRLFYSRAGFVSLEVFPDLWGPQLPVLLLIKAL